MYAIRVRTDNTVDFCDLTVVHKEIHDTNPYFVATYLLNDRDSDNPRDDIRGCGRVRTEFPHIGFYVDDEGMYKDKREVNALGSILYKGGPIVGNILLTAEELEYTTDGPDIVSKDIFADEYQFELRALEVKFNKHLAILAGLRGGALHADQMIRFERPPMEV